MTLSTITMITGRRKRVARYLRSEHFDVTPLIDIDDDQPVPGMFMVTHRRTGMGIVRANSLGLAAAYVHILELAGKAWATGRPKPQHEAFSYLDTFPPEVTMLTFLVQRLDDEEVL